MSDRHRFYDEKVRYAELLTYEDARNQLLKHKPPKAKTKISVDGSRPVDADVIEPDEDSDEEPGIEDDIEEDPANFRTAYLLRVDQAIRFASYSGPITQEIVEAARAVAAAWSSLATKPSSVYRYRKRWGLRRFDTFATLSETRTRFDWFSVCFATSPFDGGKPGVENVPQGVAGDVAGKVEKRREQNRQRKARHDRLARGLRNPDETFAVPARDQAQAEEAMVAKGCGTVPQLFAL